MIQLSALQKTKNGQTGLSLSDINIPSGDIFAFVGGVESGKETLFNLLIGREQPSAGQILIDGVSPRADQERFGEIVGVLFAENNLYERQSVRANLEFFARLLGKKNEAVETVLSLIGMQDLSSFRTGALSASQARRLAFGRAILHQPQSLILFEPFHDCDENTIATLTTLIRDAAQQGKSVLILSEETGDILSLADRVGRLEQGRLKDVFSPRDLEEDKLPIMLPVRLQDKVVLVDPADILVVFSQDEKIYIQTTKEVYPSQYTLTELDKRLTRRGFFRAHRAYLVNLQKIKEVIPFTRDSFSLRLKDDQGSLIPLSKSAEKELRELLGY